MKKLLFSLIFAGISAVTFNAQSKTWDFSDTTKFTAGAISTDTTIDGLSFLPGGSALTISTTNLATFTDPAYVPTQRLAFGGNSYTGSLNPAVGTTLLAGRRVLQFAVSNNATIKLWARGGGAGRSLLISDAAGKVLNSTTFAGNTTSDIAVASYTYTGTAGNIMITVGGGDNSLYKIEYTDNSSLAVNDIKSGLKAKAFSIGNKIYVSNLESKKTDINVYNANGSLMKSLKSSTDTNIEINAKGLYIVTLSSEAGAKSVKVLLK